jgi:hypothetical protein
MSSPTTQQREPDGHEPVGPAVLSCPKCHAPLELPSAADPSSRRRRRARHAPLWLRSIILVLLLAAAAAPIVAVIYVRGQTAKGAIASAREFLDEVPKDDDKDAKNMLTEDAKRQVTAYQSLRTILRLPSARYQISTTRQNGELMEVAFTCFLPEGTKIPRLPVKIDVGEQPKANLVMDRAEDGRWHVRLIKLLDRNGLHPPVDAPKDRVIPSFGGAGPEPKVKGSKKG